MKLGNLNLSLFILILFFFSPINSQDNIILQDLEPTFEEEADTNEINNEEEAIKIKSKEKKNKLKNEQIIVNLRALDKITAKTSDININLGNKKKFGYLEIFPKNCKKVIEKNYSGFVVYLQVKDLSDKKDEKVFVFNGWTFSSNRTLAPFDHPVYDLWITGCENI